jgi:cytochrome c-type biogenesis protein CcmH/NrfG
MTGSRKSPTRLLLIVALSAIAGLCLLAWASLGPFRPAASRAGAAAGAARDADGPPAGRRAQIIRARRLIDSGEYPEAVAALDRALAASPRDSEAMALQVRALRSQRHYTAARAAARRVLEIAPDSPLGFILLGSIAMQQGDAATARRELSRAIERDTSSALALSQLASLDLMEGRVPEARHHAQMALRLQSDAPEALRVLSRLTRSVPELISISRRLVAASPGDLLTRSWLGVLEGSAVPEVNYLPALRGPTTVPCEAGPDGRLFVRARVGPVHGLRLLVDTGATGLTLSETLARSMGMRLVEFSESAGVGGLRRHSHPILVDRIEVGGMRARAVMATASDLPETLDGILNPLLFAPAGSGVTLEVRPGRPALVFTRSGDPGLAGAGAPWASVPFLADGNHIIFRIVLGGRPAMALLDTGAAADMVDRTVLERLPGVAVEPAGDQGESLIGFGGAIEDAATADQVMLRVAGHEFGTRRLFVVDLNQDAFRFQVDLDAIVGMECLRTFDLRIEPASGLLRFRPAD